MADFQEQLQKLVEIGTITADLKQAVINAEVTSWGVLTELNVTQLKTGLAKYGDFSPIILVKLLWAAKEALGDAAPTSVDVLYKQATFEKVPWHPCDVNPHLLSSRSTSTHRLTSIHLPNIFTVAWDGFLEAAANVPPFEEHALKFTQLLDKCWSKRHEYGAAAPCNENGWRATLAGLAFKDILTNLGQSQGFALKPSQESSSASRSATPTLDLGPRRAEGATNRYGRSTTQLAPEAPEQNPDEQRHAQLSHDRSTIPDYCFERIESGTDLQAKKAVVKLKKPLTLGLEAGDAEGVRERVEHGLSLFDGNSCEYEYAALWQVVTQMITHSAPSALLTNAITYVFLRLSECRSESGSYSWKLHYYVADIADDELCPTTNQCIAYLLNELRVSKMPQWCKDAVAIRSRQQLASGPTNEQAESISLQPSAHGTAQAGPSDNAHGSGPDPTAWQTASCIAATHIWALPTWAGEANIIIDVDAVGEVVAQGHYGSVLSYGADCVLKLAPDSAPHAREELLNEMLMYHHAVGMQGDCLPKVKLAGFDPERRQHAIIMERAGPDAAHLPLSRVAAVSADILAAYQKLWAHGLLHGDVALRNIAITVDGRVVLLDLGHARPLKLVHESRFLHEQAIVADLCSRLQWQARQAQRARR